MTTAEKIIGVATFGIDDVCEMLGVSPTTFSEMRGTGFPEPVFGKRWTRQQVEAYLRQVETFGSWTLERHQQYMRRAWGEA